MTNPHPEQSVARTTHIPSDPDTGPGLFKPNPTGSGQSTSRLRMHRDMGVFYCETHPVPRPELFSPLVIVGIRT
jgi:hypothetical protein